MGTIKKTLQVIMEFVKRERKFYKELYEETCTSYAELNNKYYDLNQKNELFEKVLILIDNEKNSSWVLLDLVRENNSYQIWFYRMTYFSNMEKSSGSVSTYDICVKAVRLHFFNRSSIQLLFMEAEYNQKTKTIELVDIQSEKDKGLGTQALNHLKNWGKTFGSEKIVAWLSTVDLYNKNDPNNYERLHRFYEKNGFKVISHNDRKDKNAIYIFP